MIETELLKYGRYITSLISSVILNTAPPTPFEDIDWSKLFRLAKKHDVAVMIYPAVKKLGIPADAMELFNKNYNVKLACTTRQNIEAEHVLAELEKNSIKYIKLKGAHIKHYYPDNCIRTFGDVDLCVTPEGRESAKPIMENLGYSLDHALDYHDEYEKGDFYYFEFHSSVTPVSSKYADVFSDPFSKAIATNESEFSYVFNNEYFYLHLLIHLHKHFTTRGCGIRLFVDFLVFEQKIKDVDFKLIKSVLKQYDLLDFYNTVRHLVDFFFYNKKATNNICEIAQYILENQTMGTTNHHIANFNFWGKIRYFLRIWFPSAKRFAYRYPILNKVPILLPVCWVRRFFYSLFFNRSSIKTQANTVKEAGSAKYRNIKRIRKMAEESQQ